MAKLTLTLSQAFSRAFSAYNAGKLVEAEQLCQQIINAKPYLFDALHLLAVVQSSLGKKDTALASYDRALAVQPDYAEALSNRGLTLHQLKRFEDALASYDRALTVRPDYAEALSNRGFTLHQLKRFEEAVASYDKAIALKPDYAEAFNNRGNALKELKRFEAALASYDKAIALKPDYAEAFNNRGNALRDLKRPEEALASYDKAIALKRNYAEAYNNRGGALRDLKRSEEALASYDKAIALKPDYADSYYNRGLALQDLKRPAEALANYDKAIALQPDNAQAYNNRGAALRDLKRPEEALASYNKAITLKPDHAAAYNNRGYALRDLKRSEEALASYDKAIALKADYAEAYSGRGAALWDLKRPEEALASYDKAIALQPDYADALNNRGVALTKLKRFEEALASFDRALAVEPDHAHAFSGIIDCINKLCDWRRTTDVADDVIAHVSKNKSIIAPFVLLGYSDDPVLQLQCARNLIADRFPSLPGPLWTGARWRHDKVRIGYLSADFRQHAVAYLMAELFERHDRSRFEIIGVSFGADDKSEMRKRLVAAFDRFYDVREKSDKEVAKLLHDLQVDIAIDLMGYTMDSRSGILAYRPAPIQASYLGFPGTMGAEFIDYIIADKTVAPFEHQPFYTEKVVHLPDCFQVNDRNRKIAVQTPTREETGLPAEAFVFCCFNNNWKITPTIFDVWMRLLSRIEGSVLWLSQSNDTAVRNLRGQADARGIETSRLIFAPRVLRLDDHLARHRLADLFLDTLPFNAHTTASDALWAGLPVITQLGEAFAGRVAASLLNAIGLAELVTHSIEDYEALALRLAKHPTLLEGYRHRLATNRLTHPLFDTDRFRLHIEAAYLKMWEIWQRGEQPRSFAVEPKYYHLAGVHEAELSDPKSHFGAGIAAVLEEAERLKIPRFL